MASAAAILCSDVSQLKEQLSIARKEIQNLRKQIKSLTYAHQTDVKNIKDVLNEFQCTQCKRNHCSSVDTNPFTQSVELNDKSKIEFKPIGIIRSDFPEKRAVPRQPTVCQRLQGCIQLSRDVFNNPEHSLDGLNEFSHLWIIYHFHRNDAHAKAKVAPPRLGGERIGIFSTRSPHRPCPIGLSLVEIDRIDGALIYFFGTDMVDGTPVLDIKPFIPRYDSPMYGSEFECISSFESEDYFGSREAPDGEETDLSNTASGGAFQPTITNSPSILLQPNIPNSTSRDNLLASGVKVPKWVLSDAVLDVLFNERAEEQLIELQVNKAHIKEVLQVDPRSVYLRTRYGSQIFTFQLGEVTVTCKFDDGHSLVTVLQIRKSVNLSTESSD